VHAIPRPPPRRGDQPDGWTWEQLNFALGPLPDLCCEAECDDCAMTVGLWIDMRRALGILHMEHGHC
jgi:hypothetical protein